MATRKKGEKIMTIGENLKKMRKSFQLTQTDIAECLDVSTQQVYKYEQGIDRIDAEKLAKLSTLFGCDMEDFLIAKEDFGNNGMLMLSEKKKSLPKKRSAKNNEIVEMLKTYIQLDTEDKEKVKSFIEDLKNKTSQVQ